MFVYLFKDIRNRYVIPLSQNICLFFVFAVCYYYIYFISTPHWKRVHCIMFLFVYINIRTLFHHHGHTCTQSHNNKWVFVENCLNTITCSGSEYLIIKVYDRLVCCLVVFTYIFIYLLTF